MKKQTAPEWMTHPTCPWTAEEMAESRTNAAERPIQYGTGKPTPRKLTKREYTRRMAELTAHKELIEQNIALIIDNELIHLYDGLNAAHDKVYEIQQAIEQLDFAYRTRNWNSSDWAMNNLILQNID